MFFVFAVVVVAASVFVVVAVVVAVVVDADASVVSAAYPVSANVVVVVVVSEAASPPKCFAALTEQTAVAETQNSAAFVSWLLLPADAAFERPLSLHHQYFRRSSVSFGSGCFSFLASCFRRLYLLHHRICLWPSVSFE